jgi:YD repeat-containing protein
VDQRYTPGEVKQEGLFWRSLGFFTPDEDGKIIVELTGAWNNGQPAETVAQSIMMVKNWTFGQRPVGSFSALAYRDGPASGDPKEFVLSDEFGGKATFDAQGLLQQRKDRNENMTKYEYTDADGDGLDDELEKITRQVGLETTYDYAGGHLKSVTDFSGRITDYTIDGSGKLTQIKLPAPGLGDTTRPTYAFGYAGTLLSSIKDPIGFLGNYATGIEYVSSRISKVNNPDSHSWQITPYLIDGLPSGGSGSAPIRKPATGLIGEEEIVANLPSGALREPRTTFTDGRTNKWYYQTDVFGLTTALSKPVTPDLPKQDVWKWERRNDGLPTKFSQPKGGGGNTPITTRLDTLYDPYDSKGNLLHATYPDQTTESWQYNAQFAVITEFTDQLQRVTDYALDAHGNVQDVKTMAAGSAARIFHTEYSAVPTGINSLPGGLPTEVTEAYGSADAATTVNEYFTSGANVGLLKKVTHADGTVDETVVAQYDYDSHRNLETSKDAMLNPTTNLYDDLDRLRKVTYPLPGTGSDPAPFATFTYDASGNLNQSQDVRGVIANFYYDKLNRTECVDAPSNGGSPDSNQSWQTTHNVYDENGNLKRIEYPLGRQASFDYDPRNQQVKTTLPAPGITLPPGMNVTLAGAPITNYIYDALGNLASVSDPRNGAWKTTYSYDKLSRKTVTTMPATEDHGETTYVTHYDDLGRVASADAPGPNGGLVTTSFEYDRSDRLVKETPPLDATGQRAIVEMTYDLRDNVLTVSVAGRVTETYYDRLDRPTDVYAPDPNNGHGRMRTYNVYDPVGNVTYTSTFEDGQPGNMITTAFAYDNLGRVITETGTDPDGSGPSMALVTTRSYDGGGNVIQTIETGGPTTRQTDTYYDNYNRPWDVLGVAVAGVRPETVSIFNAAGDNVETREKTAVTVSGESWRSWNYFYDQLGRLYETLGPVDNFGNRPATYSIADEDGNVRYSVNPLGRITEQTYDTLGNLKRVIEPAIPGQPPVQPTTYVYNLAGLVASVTDSLLRVTANRYDIPASCSKRICRRSRRGLPTSSTPTTSWGIWRPNPTCRGTSPRTCVTI